jgi:site-specific DNA-methyltransferase (adenine-specific)
MINLHLGDCLYILPTLVDHSVDMVLVDLPYGTTICKWDSIIPLNKLWEQYHRICKEDGAMVFTAAQPFTTILVASNLKNFRYEWIWEKPQGVNPLTSKSDAAQITRKHFGILSQETNIRIHKCGIQLPTVAFLSDTSKIW